MNGSAPAHAVVILAAGASRRLGQPKQLLPAPGGEPLVRRVTRLALDTQPHTTVVVLGAGADAVFAAIADLAVRRVDCAQWAEGMGASLRSGLAALPDAVAGALILLCDQPALDTPHLLALRDAWRAQPDRAAASRYAGRLGVPALIPRAWFAEFAPNGGDIGARELLAQRSAEVVAIADERLAFDVDVPADLARLDEQPR
jgi:CTP:molybdopterin cytidylyltransferase MocA